MNLDSSSTEHLLKKSGFQSAELEDSNHWLFAKYWQAVQQLARQHKSVLSLEVIATRFVAMIEIVISESRRG